MGWAFTGVTLPRLSKVGAGPEIVRLRDLTVVFILTLFRSRVTGEKREGRRKTRKRKGRGSHILSLPHLPPLISHSFGSNSRVAGEKREGGGGRGRKKAWEGKGRGSLSPFSLISRPWFHPLHFRRLPRRLTLSLWVPVFRRFHNWQLLKVKCYLFCQSYLYNRNAWQNYLGTQP